MGRILRIYIIREVALPTLMALLTIIFILLMGRVYVLINLLLQPGVGLWQVVRVLFSFMPAMLVLAIPMSILIGTLVGVGRMTLDREILAIRASGVNLFNVFYPTVLVAGLISLSLMMLSGAAIPKLLQGGLSQISELQFAVINSLEPGRFHDKLGGSDTDYALYFRDRDPKSGQMKGVAIKLEDELRDEKELKAGQPDEKRRDDSPGKNKEEDVKGSATTAVTPIPAAAATTETANGSTSGTPQAADAATTAPAEGTLRNTELTIVFAESGLIESSIEEMNEKGDQRAAILLTLRNGTVHRMIPEPGNKRYVVIRFDKMDKRIYRSAVIPKRHKTMSNDELRQMIAENRSKADDKEADGTPEDKSEKKKKEERRQERRGVAKRELAERRSISLASLVFALIGIPLAIWIKPSGKSWGILLAISLMLVYYILMKMGLTMVEVEKPLGVPLAYLPNLLFVVLGAGLWWQSVRS